MGTGRVRVHKRYQIHLDTQCITVRYRKSKWTQLPDTREVVGWSVTRRRYLLMTGTDLLGGDTDTPVVSRRSESEQGRLCVTGGIGKYDMMGVI